MDNTLDAAYWSKRYLAQQTGWDMGQVSPPLKAYIDQIEDKGLKILIPGAGAAYEAAYLWSLGFRQIWVCDWAMEAFDTLRSTVPEFPEAQMLIQDFFTIEQTFDLVLEQTFFCALDPTLREAYARKMQSLLSPNGKLVGLLFGMNFEKQGPPFGGNLQAYQFLFEQYFTRVTLTPCYNSISPRKDSELFLMASV